MTQIMLVECGHHNIKYGFYDKVNKVFLEFDDIQEYRKAMVNPSLI